MNLIYASLLLHSAGKPVTEESVKKIAEATGEKVEEAQIKALCAALEGVNIDDVISKASMPVAVAAATTTAAPAEAKKEEKDDKEIEKKAEEAAEGLGALFG